MKAADLFDLPENFPFKAHFSVKVAPWEWLPQIADALGSVNWGALQSKEDVPAGVHIEGDVYLHPSVQLPPYAFIKGPAWIGANTEIRPGAYLRGNVIVGENCVLGNSCEYKNCLLLNDVESAHFNYVGDSILGNKAHLGAGAILANLRLDKQTIKVKSTDGLYETHLRKIGGILGDGAEALCNCVLNPGSILDRNSVVMSGVSHNGYLKPNTIHWGEGKISLR